MKLELTDQEASVILEMADTALKQHGIRALGAANIVVNKINAARIAEQNEKTTCLNPVADSVASSSPG